MKLTKEDDEKNVCVCVFLVDCSAASLYCPSSTGQVNYFYSNEKQLFVAGFYHILQLICLFAWGGLFLSMFMLLSTKIDGKLPRWLKTNRHNAIAVICFISGNSHAQ